MSLLGSLAYVLFLTFPLYPLVYFIRLVSRARSRAPVLALAYHAQTVAFMTISGWFVWVAKPTLVGLRGTAAASSFPTLALMSLSDAVRTAPGALLAVALAVCAVRCAGRLFAHGWRRPEVPVWRLDLLALVLWVEFALLLSLLASSLLLPLLATVD